MKTFYATYAPYGGCFGGFDPLIIAETKGEVERRLLEWNSGDTSKMEVHQLGVKLRELYRDGWQILPVTIKPTVPAKIFKR